jgi:hypothetical protein
MPDWVRRSCGVQEWQRMRKARRAINDLLASIEGRERKAK